MGKKSRKNKSSSSQQLRQESFSSNDDAATAATSTSTGSNSSCWGNGRHRPSFDRRAAMVSDLFEGMTMEKDDEEDDETGVNPLDDKTDIKEWIEKDKIDPKSLAKRFPHTAQDLCDQKVKPDDIANHLIKLSGMPSDIDRLERWCDKLTLLCLPPECRECRPVFRIQMRVFFQKRPPPVGEQQHEHQYDDRNELKNALNDTCRKLAWDFDKMMNVKKGTFLKNCILYKKTQEEFNTDIVPHLFDKDEKDMASKRDSFKTLLRDAAMGIADGCLDIKNTCWECGNKCTKVIFSCSGCNVALYCAPECQKNAWQTGHSKKCCELGAKSILFHDALKEIDEAHRKYNEIITAAKLKPPLSINSGIDCNLAYTFITHKSPFEGTPWEGKIPGPRMAFFYENVARVDKDHWWVYPASENMTPKEFVGKCTSSSEANLFFDFAYCLSFDYGGDADLFQEIYHQPDSYASRKKKQYGLAYPAEQFKNLYEILCKNLAVSGNLSIVKRHEKGKAQLHFRKNCHK